MLWLVGIFHFMSRKAWSGLQTVGVRASGSKSRSRASSLSSEQSWVKFCCATIFQTDVLRNGLWVCSTEGKVDDGRTIFVFVSWRPTVRRTAADVAVDVGVAPDRVMMSPNISLYLLQGSEQG